MSNNDNDPEVKIIGRSEVAPSKEDEENDDTENETQPDSSQEGKNDDEGDEKEPESEATDDESEEEESEESSPAADLKPKTPEAPRNEKYGDIKRVEGETDREFAQRLEIARLREKIRGDQTKEILTPPPVSAKQELPPEKKKVLDKYKPEDIQVLKEVFDVMAEDMGFVKKDQLNQTTFQEKASEVLDEFLEKHPEYLPQNDEGNVLWGRFKEEYGLYRPPQSVKQLKQMLEKAHKEVFGIKPAAAITNTDAAKEKIKVASHSSASRPAPSREGVKRNAAPTQGLRLDMLKGFSEEEIADLNAS